METQLQKAEVVNYSNSEKRIDPLQSLDDDQKMLISFGSKLTANS